MTFKTKIKICFVQLHAYSFFDYRSKANIGGSELQLSLLAQELAKNKQQFDISFIVADWGQKNLEIRKNIKIYKSFPLKKGVLNYLQAYFLLSKLLKIINADTYILSANGLENIIITLFAKRHKKKVIYRIASNKNLLGKKTKNLWLKQSLFQFCLAAANTIVCQTKDQQKLLKNNNHLSKSTIIRNIILHQYPPTQYNHKANKNLILWVGRAIPCKQPQVFLELAKMAPEEQFAIILTPDDHNSQKLWDKIKNQTEKINNCLFLGIVPYSKSWLYFNKAKILINTSDYEGFPNTFLQAAACRTPIVSLNVNPDNFLNEYRCGFCANGSIKKILKTIKELSKNQILCQKLGNNAFEYIKDNHNNKLIISLWKKIL